MFCQTRTALRARLSPAVIAAFVVSACAADPSGMHSRDGASSDASHDHTASVDGGPACGASICAAGERCFQARCIPDNGTCMVMPLGDGGADGALTAGGCGNDSICIDGVCVPFGTAPAGDRDPTCTRFPAPLDHFAAVIQCEWPGGMTIDAPGSVSVRVPPLVADLDGDHIPEVIFVSEGPTADATRVRVIRGDTCAPVWSSSHAQEPDQELAVGDLDGDGRPEICGRAGSGIPYCLRADGSSYWDGHNADGTAHPVEADKAQIGLSIANVDGAGPPELIVGIAVFNAQTGLYLRGPDAPEAGTWAWSGTIPAIADLDGDGAMEALTGGQSYNLVTGVATDWHTNHGYTAVGDLIAGHPGPEIVAVSPNDGTIRVHAMTGEVLWNHAVPGGNGGAPTIADLDGDGHAEFAVAGHAFFTAFDLDCVPMFAPGPDDRARCTTTGGMTDGVMWSIPTHDLSSGITGSSVFDFEGDGPVEVIYGDECWTRVLDGATGAVKFSAPHESGTGIEYPVVADCDGDGYTELIAPHESYPMQCPMADPLAPSVMRDPSRGYAGVTIYRDRDDRWAPSRPLWTQHTEHYSERADNGSVPVREPPSWTTHNSYRQALPAGGRRAIDAPDLTVTSLMAPACDTATDTQPLSARICNRGTVDAPSGITVSFRVDSPTGAVACSAMTAAPIPPGMCVPVSCVWNMVPVLAPHDVYTVVNPPDGVTVVPECHADNNTTRARVACPPEIG